MNGGNVLPYIDVPFQHASPAVLKAMRRPAAQEKTLERIRAWRAICPDLTIRSTFIVGFPGETEEDFRFLLDWLDEAKLDRVGAFQYEPVKGAAANDLGLEPVPDDIKASRYKRFMAARPGDQREEARRQGRQAARGHRRRGRRARGQGPQQGRLAADRRRRAHRDAQAVARRRHRDRQDRALRRLRFMGHGGLRAANRRSRRTATSLEPPRTDIRASRRRSAGRPPQSAAPAGVRDPRRGDQHGGARRVHRHGRAANDGAPIRRRAGERDLDRQRLSTRGHRIPFAVGRAWRQARLPARLLVGACALHRRLARLRARADLRRAHRRARCSGPGRGGNHERQHRAHSLRLSARTAWPGGRQHGGDGRRLHGRKPERRRGDPFGRLLALAVSHQRAAWRPGAGDGGADAARDAARRRAPRSFERAPQRAHFRTRHRRRQPDRSRGSPLVGAD